MGTLKFAVVVEVVRLGQAREEVVYFEALESAERYAARRLAKGMKVQINSVDIEIADPMYRDS